MIQKTTTHAELLSFAREVVSRSCNRESIAELIMEIMAEKRSPKWEREFHKFHNWYNQYCKGNVTLVNTIFARKGNMKLSFLSFSTMPIIDCPGYGICGKFCYSKNAWRNVSPFFRMLRNSIITRNHFDIIAAEFTRVSNNLHKRMEFVDFRLYVDGDFDSVETVKNWQDLLKTLPFIRAYGYSKSWVELLNYHKNHSFADNYVLNLSNGGKYSHNSGIHNAVKKLPCVRGNFLALPVKKLKTENYSDSSYREKAKAAAKSLGITKFFICTGLCDNCTPKGHFCGSKNMKADVITLTH